MKMILILYLFLHRVDVQRDVDIEDVLRIYGYNNVEISSKVNSSLNYGENRIRTSSNIWFPNSFLRADFMKYSIIHSQKHSTTSV